MRKWGEYKLKIKFHSSLYIWENLYPLTIQHFFKMTVLFHTPASHSRQNKHEKKRKDKDVMSLAVRFKSDTPIHHSNIFQTGKPRRHNTGSGKMLSWQPGKYLRIWGDCSTGEVVVESSVSPSWPLSVFVFIYLSSLMSSQLSNYNSAKCRKNQENEDETSVSHGFSILISWKFKAISSNSIT